MQSFTEVSSPAPAYNEDQRPQTLLDAIVLRVRDRLQPGERYTTDVRSLLQAAAAHSVGTSTEAAAGSQPSDSREEPQALATPIWETPTFKSFQRAVELEFFDAIRREDLHTITYLVSSGIVNPDTLHIAHKKTPLTAALDPYPDSNNPDRQAPPPSSELIVRLLEFCSNPNILGIVGRRSRTPLMLAAARGLLPIVRMLVSEPVCADDAVVAPDGETALHLAAAAGHAAVVEFLPARRGGGLRRLQWSLRRHMWYAREELGLVWDTLRYIIWPIVNFLVWTAPKFFLWDSPRWVWHQRARLVALAEAIWRGICGIPDAVWGAVKKIPQAVSRAGKAAWKFATQTLPRWGKKAAARIRTLFTETLPRYVKAVPRLLKNGAIWVRNLFTGRILIWLKESAKWLIKLFTEKLPALLRDGALWIKKTLTETLPRLSKEFVLWLWTLVTERIPKALATIATWIKEKVINICKAVYNVLTSFIALLHTTLLAVITFLRNVTLRDIWNGLCDLLHAVFVELPLALWDCVDNFHDVAFRVLKYLFNEDIAFVVMLILTAIYELVAYLPKKLLVLIVRVLLAIRDMMHEVIVCINPKMVVHTHRSG